MCHPSCLQAQCLKGSGEVSKEKHPFCEEVDKEHLTLDILKKSYYTSDRGLLYCVPLGVKILAGKKDFMYVPNNGENNSLAQKYVMRFSMSGDAQCKWFLTGYCKYFHLYFGCLKGIVNSFSWNKLPSKLENQDTARIHSHKTKGTNREEIS